MIVVSTALNQSSPCGKESMARLKNKCYTQSSHKKSKSVALFLSIYFSAVSNIDYDDY